MDKKILKNIARELPHGSIKEIAKRAKVSRVTVNKFFKGDTENKNVALAITAVYKEHKQQQRKNEKSLTALLAIK